MTFAPAGARPHPRGCAGGMAGRGRPSGGRVPRDQQEPAGHGADADPRSGRRRHRPVPGDLAGGGRAGAAHRLRQHRQPAAGPGHRAAARVRRPARARRRARPAGAAAAHRGAVPGGARRGGRRGARRTSRSQTTRDFLPANVVRFVPGHEYLRLDVGVTRGHGRRSARWRPWCSRWYRRCRPRDRPARPACSRARGRRRRRRAGNGCGRCSPARRWR